MATLADVLRINFPGQQWSIDLFPDDDSATYASLIWNPGNSVAKPDLATLVGLKESTDAVLEQARLDREKVSLFESSEGAAIVRALSILTEAVALLYLELRNQAFQGDTKPNPVGLAALRNRLNNILRG